MDNVQESSILNEVENWKGKGNYRIKKSKKKVTTEKLSVNVTVPECPTCADGNFASGDAHRCAQCKKPVHVFDTYSRSIENEEEGYGQKRICLDCAQNTSQNSHGARETVTVTKKSYRKPAKFLGMRKADVKDTLNWNKNNNIPVIRNGNECTLTPVSIDGKTISLNNTCSFDSVLYLTILAANDFIHIRNIVSIANFQLFLLQTKSMRAACVLCTVLLTVLRNNLFFISQKPFSFNFDAYISSGER